MTNELWKYLTSMYRYPIPQWGSQINFNINTDPIQYTLLDKAHLYMTDGLWACPLVFSNFPFDDFYWLFSAVLLEHHIVFVSQNYTLLTSTVLALLALIRPLRWVSPVVCTLPDKLLDLLSSPVPVIIGLPCSKDYLIANHLIETYDQCLFVSVDDCKIFGATHLMSNSRIPTFNGLIDKLKPYYNHFNSSKTVNTPIVNLTAFSKNINVAQLRNFSEGGKKLIYKPKAYDIEMTMQIIEIFRETMTRCIAKCVPVNPPYMDSNQMVMDHEKILACLAARNPTDKEFFNQFVRTQLFAVFLEEHYETSKMP